MILEIEKQSFIHSQWSDLMDVLNGLGMVSMFSDDADFSNLTKDAIPLFVSNIRQKIHVEVDEDGTRSSAVTEAEMSTSMDDGYKSFCANKPFVFVLTEKATGTILFIGQYTGQE